MAIYIISGQWTPTPGMVNSDRYTSMFLPVSRSQVGTSVQDRSTGAPPCSTGMLLCQLRSKNTWNLHNSLLLWNMTRPAFLNLHNANFSILIHWLYWIKLKRNQQSALHWTFNLSSIYRYSLYRGQTVSPKQEYNTIAESRFTILQVTFPKISR